MAPETDSLPSGKYAAEFWHASHTDLNPCDLYQVRDGVTPVIVESRIVKDLGWEIDVQPAPRYKLESYVWDGFPKQSIRSMNYRK